jgi:hypothetical protein
MLLYLTECLDKDSALIEPHKYINLLHAISWATEAWREGVKETTIQNCFLKAKVKVHGSGIPDPDNLRLRYPDREVRMEMNRLEDELEAVSGALGIHDPLLIEQLLDHADEIVQDEELNEREIEVLTLSYTVLLSNNNQFNFRIALYNNIIRLKSRLRRNWRIYLLKLYPIKRQWWR